MNKSEKIDYLNSIKRYLNLSALCELYNKTSKEYIDYNNLRIVLNGNSETRLSEKKLDAFIEFLHVELFDKIFKVGEWKLIINQNQIDSIIEKHAKNLKNELTEKINNGFCN